MNLPRLKFAPWLPVFFMMALHFPGYSQAPVNVQQAADLLQKIDARSLNQSELKVLMSDKNTQESGKDRNSIKPNEKMQSFTVKEDSVRPQSQLPKAMIYNPENTYGANIFSTAAVNNTAELSTPPLDYPIGVGDNMIVALWGGAELQQSYVVSRDGSIFPQGIGKINVGGLTFNEARSIIEGRFKAVVPGGTRISVTLGQPRTINVNVVGEVLNPGPFTVSAFSNAFNVIAAAGGITEYGNLRSILVKRGGQVVDEIDVYKYLNSGDFGKQIYLQNNDFVIVGFVEKKIKATGQFKRPMFYQLKKEEGVRDLLKFSGGLNAAAASSVMRIVRVENQKYIQKDVNVGEVYGTAGDDFLLKDGDMVKVDLIRQGMENKVELKGEVNYPGQYELKSGEGVFDLINRAGGITRYTYLHRALILRGAGDSLNNKAQTIEVDLSGFNDKGSAEEQNVKLEPFDIIQLFSENDFAEQQFVDVFGEVRKAGRFRRYIGMTLKDLLFMAGGLKPSAEFGRLEISSIVDRDSAQKGLKPTRTVIRSYAILPDLSIDSTAIQVEIKPYDQVFIRKNPSFEFQENIDIKGMVKYPGKYPRLDKNEKISSYIMRAGGFQPNANLAGAVLYRTKTQFFRESVVEKQKMDSLKGTPEYDSIAEIFQNLEEPVSIDLYSALNQKDSRQDIVLQGGDMLFVPEINPFVTTKGSVQSPLRIAFNEERRRLTYYLDKSGGFGENPWKRRVFVTYANGRSKRTKNFMFFHFYPKVKEGSVITVPTKPKSSDFGDVVKSTLVAAIPVVLTAIALKYIQ